MPYVSQDVIYMIKQCRLESLKVCDNGWFIFSVLYCTLSVVWGIFDIHHMLEVGSIPILGHWLSLYWHLCY
jgi:hypothetical protein